MGINLALACHKLIRLAQHIYIEIATAKETGFKLIHLVQHLSVDIIKCDLSVFRGESRFSRY
jgi:hypothetical protein